MRERTSSPFQNGKERENSEGMATKVAAWFAFRVRI